MAAVLSKLHPLLSGSLDQLFPFAHGPRVTRRHPRSRRFACSIERLEDRTLPSTFVVTSPLDVVDADDGVTTFREAILAANAQSGHDTIAFDITGTGVHTIRPGWALPTITDAVTIDGTTQAGFDGTPVIELDGSMAGWSSGLIVTAGGSTIRGLAVNQFGINGIVLRKGGGNVLEGNYIGTDAGGTLARGNRSQGVLLDDSPNNTIGGTALGAGNVISANGGNGVVVAGPGAAGNVLLGNRIGTDASGTANLGNGFNGIFLSAASGNTIGGGPGVGNLISGNRANGVYMQAGANDNLVSGNRIGTDASGTGALGNHQRGVFLYVSAARNQIGGSHEQGNVIAFNHGDGVGVFYLNSAGNTFRGNSIHSNGGLGSDLGVNGRTQNDELDLDGGANLLQNFPVLSEAGRSDTQVRLTGVLHSAAGATFTVDFYASPAGDPATFSGGARWLGSVTVTADDLGNAAFEATFEAAVAAGELVTATATDFAGNTSEYSDAVVAVTVDLEPSTAADRIDLLITQISEWSTSGLYSESTARTIVASLETALVKLQQGNSTAAANNLGAAANKVQALMRSGRLSAELGESLLEEIGQARDQIHSGSLAPSSTAAAAVTVTTEPSTPVERLDVLIAQISSDWSMSGAFSETSARTIIESLETAVSRLQQGKDIPAANKLTAAANKVQALVRSGRLSAAYGESLLDEIGQARDQIDGESQDPSNATEPSGEFEALDEFFVGTTGEEDLGPDQAREQNADHARKADRSNQKGKAKADRQQNPVQQPADTDPEAEQNGSEQSQAGDDSE